MTTEEMDAVEARAKAATPGPWEAEGPGGYVGADIDGVTRQVATAQGDAAMHGDPLRSTVDIQRSNAAFIAHAREDVPRLLSALRASQAKVAGHEAAQSRIAVEFAVLRSDLAACRSQVEALTKALETTAAEAFDDGWRGAFVSVRRAMEAAISPQRERLLPEVSAFWMHLNGEIDRAALAALKPSEAKEEPTCPRCRALKRQCRNCELPRAADSEPCSPDAAKVDGWCSEHKRWVTDCNRISAAKETT